MTLPPMTLQQAAELANRITTIGDGIIPLIANGNHHDITEHAAHAYKALTLIFTHARTLEETLTTMTALLESSTAILRTLNNSPLWPQIEQTLLTTPDPKDQP